MFLKVHDLSETVDTRGFNVVFRQPDLASDVFLKQYRPAAWAAFLVFMFVLAMGILLLEDKDHGWGMKDGLFWIAG